MGWLHRERIAFTAKTVTDLGKAILVVALAGYFFEKYPLGMRIAITLLGVTFMTIGIIIFPEGGEK